MLATPAPPPAAVRLVPLLTDVEGSPGRSRRLTGPLEARYGGALAIPLRTDRPTVVSNFVSTLDGVVSYNTAEAAGGGEISGFFEPDRFVMGVLRALSDTVLIGAGTLRAAPQECWTAGFIHPPSASEFVDLRSELGLRPQPLTAVVTASGSIDLAHPGLANPDVAALVITTDAGAQRLAHAPAHIGVHATGDRVRPADILDALAAAGAQVVLCEGGPHLLGHLLDAHLVDELFLTLAPQLAGRPADAPRLGLVEGTGFDVASAPWARLVDLRRAGDHLFTRYRLNGEPST
jgi:riboflavin biosynthesis pyrimidine reductase